jgi:hypothetical protein
LNKVGVVRIGGVVRIAPKLPIRRPFFLLSYAAGPRGVQHPDNGDGEVGGATDLLPAVAYAGGTPRQRLHRWRPAS